MNPRWRPVFEASVLAFLALLIHGGLLYVVWPDRMANWRYPIAALYGFFYLCSLVIVRILVRRKQKNIDSVGQTFMALTCVKAVLAYILLHPILSADYRDVAFEKINFFSVFAVFLTIETVVSVRLLQKN